MSNLDFFVYFSCKCTTCRFAAAIEYVDQARKHIKAAVDGSPFAMVSIMAVVTNFPLKMRVVAGPISQTAGELDRSKRCILLQCKQAGE